MLTAQNHSDFDHEQPMRKTVRRLRGFRASFEEQLRTTSQHTGIRYALDGKALTAAFMAWLDDFEAQKPDQEGDKAAYVGFAAGLMLRALIRHDPLRATHVPSGINAEDPSSFWPEGYVYVAYCLNIRACVLEQDFHAPVHQADELNDLQTWWSFRENVHEDPSLAIAFLDLFSGQEPNWCMPALFASQRYRAVTQRTFAQLQNDQSSGQDDL